jgi:hypothetical protein
MKLIIHENQLETELNDSKIDEFMVWNEKFMALTMLQLMKRHLPFLLVTSCNYLQEYSISSGSQHAC